MFSSGPNYSKLKTNLRLAMNRLKLLGNKKTELALKNRREIADYIKNGKVERAKIRVEYIIREDYLVEAMEIVEMYCDLILARFGLVTQMKELDEGLAEAITSLLWVAPRLQSDVAELKIISEVLAMKYGREFVDECQSKRNEHINEKLVYKMSVAAPPKKLVEQYMIEIAKLFDIPYEPDLDVLNQGKDDKLIDLGGPPEPPGFIGYPSVFPQPGPGPFSYPPLNPIPYPSEPYTPTTSTMNNFNETPPHAAPPNYDSLNINEEKKELNQEYTGFNLPSVPSGNSSSDENNKNDDYNLPSVPTEGDKNDIDFDELTKRFENLKKTK